MAEDKAVRERAAAANERETSMERDRASGRGMMASMRGTDEYQQQKADSEAIIRRNEEKEQELEDSAAGKEEKQGVMSKVLGVLT